MSWSLGSDPLGNPVFTADPVPAEGGPYPQERPFPAPAVGCPDGYGTIYKYDGTTECIDPRAPDIANVIQRETQGSVVDRALQVIAPTSTDPNACGLDLLCHWNKFIGAVGPWAVGVGIVVGLVAVAYIVRAFK